MHDLLEHRDCPNHFHRLQFLFLLLIVLICLDIYVYSRIDAGDGG